MKMIKLFITLLACVASNSTLAECKINDAEAGSNVEQILQLAEQKKSSDIMVTFDYTNEKLTNIINKLSAQQGINVLFPTDSEKIDTEVTLSVGRKVSLEEAWGIVNTLLNVSGFSLVPRGITYEIIDSKDANKGALPTYINIHPAQLPNNEAEIKYLYYLKNIKLDTPGSKNRANVETILRDMLSGTPSLSNYVIDEKSNSITLINKTSSIKAVMSIIIALDQEGFREAIEIVELKNNTSATNIAALLTEIIQGKTGGAFGYRGAYHPAYGGGATAKKNDDVYFSKETGIVAIERNNSIAIMGKIEAVDKVKNFIIKYLDIPEKSDKSIIHTKELKYLEAKDLAKVLQKTIKASARGHQGSSKDRLAK